ncbi:flagellar protein MotY [Shewanella sp. GXUN23E]|uniref:flagellar protein MotY n=1 Tax=Shewanella sp. GXUN23E TaxID=3422498 RepID=UPI003D7E90FE
MSKTLLCLLCLGISFSAVAELRHYRAGLDDSQWRFSASPRIECRLEHDIPAYGKAVFVSRAGKELNMAFTLDMWAKPDAATKAVLISNAPRWRPGVPSHEITSLTYHKYFNGEVPKKAAWSMLSELERGMEPTFYYRDWYQASNQVAVGLSAVNFGGKYTDFKACLASLLPYSFDDIAFTVLSYHSGGSELTEFSKTQLARVQEYLTYDPEVELVLVDGYTDSYGGRSVNKRVSEQRAGSVKALLVSGGIPEERILTAGHGETRPIGPDGTPEQRALNRRVVVRISK